jgi:type IV pilus assembly protein PilM
VKELNVEFTREILIGGKFVTTEIAKAQNLTYKEAEEQKLASADDATGFLQDFVSNVSSEINKTINFYVATKPRETVGRIYLTGGASMVAGLKDQIEKETGIDVEFLNPFLFLKNGMPEGMDEAQIFSAPVALYLSTRTDEN